VVSSNLIAQPISISFSIIFQLENLFQKVKCRQSKRFQSFILSFPEVRTVGADDALFRLFRLARVVSCNA